MESVTPDPLRSARVPAPTSRRTFCVEACRLASVFTAGSWLAACAGSPTAPSAGGGVPALAVVSGTLAASRVTVPAGASSPLAAVGGAALVQSSAGPFLVARTATDAAVALSAACTHQACTVSGYANETWVCPCHGSRFSLNGGVVSGPAPRALRQYGAAVSGDTITIDV